MKMLEKDIQKAIIDFLRYKGCVVVKFPSVGIYKKETNSYIPQPQKGISDLLVCVPPAGAFVAIEVKRPGNKATPDQEVFIQQVTTRGGRAFVAESVDDVARQLGYKI